MTLAELKTKWNEMEECGSTDNFSVSNLNECYGEALECVKSHIADFIAKECGSIKRLYEMAENCDKTCSVRSMSFANQNFNEYTDGLNAYIKDVCEKACNADDSFYEEMIDDICNTTNSSKEFVGKLFGDEVNPVKELPLSDALCCVECLQDVYEECDKFRECGSTMECSLSECAHDGCKNRLADLYYKTECAYLTEFVTECMNTYETVKECVNAPKETPQKLQVF